MVAITNGESGSSVRTKLNNTGLRKNNYAATTAPTANDDTGDGYEVGSIWLDATNDRIYIAQDVTSTAAVWDELLTSQANFTTPQIYYGYDATQFGPGSITPNPPDGSFAVGVDPSAGWYEVYQRIGGAWEDTDPDGNHIQEALVRNAAREETTGLALDALVDFYGAPIEQVTVLTTIFQAAFTAGLAAAWIDVAKGTLSIGINANTADTTTLLGLFTPGYPLRGNVAIAGNWDGYVTSAIASAGNWGTGVFVTLRLFDDASVTNASNAMDVPDSTAPQLWYVEGSSTGALFNGGVYGAIDVSNRFLVKNNENTRWVAGPVMEDFVVGDNATTSSVWDAQAQQIVISVNQNLLDDIDADIATKAPLASPALTGTPTAPTAALGTNTTQIATTAFVLANVTDATNVQAALASGGLVLSESADHRATPTAGKGEVWIRNDATQALMFTDDAGTDREVLTDGSGSTLTDKATPVAADTAIIFDSAASGASKTADLQSIVDATDAVSSNTTGITGADQITNIVSLTQAEYDAIGTKNASTVYIITT